MSGLYLNSSGSHYNGIRSVYFTITKNLIDKRTMFSRRKNHKNT
jgi:hypothetical protein